jgi:DNA polymerase I
MRPFAWIWAIDFEFKADPGERPIPECLVARELRSGELIRLGPGEFGPEPPYSIDEDSLIVAYFASAEMGCHLALGWPMPANILDLFAEFRHETNGLPIVAGRGLLGALIAHGLDHIGVTEKKEMRKLAMRGAPFTAGEVENLLDYCQTDVDALAILLPAMLPEIDQHLPQALLRGRYTKAIAAMEHAGVPIDVEALEQLKHNWLMIQDRLITDIDADYGVFDKRTFKRDRFEDFLIRFGLPWPRLETGKLDLKDNTFREMARGNPIISPLRELRGALSEMRLSDLSVGLDGRNRTLISPFSSKTGRNQPSNSHFIFGPSVWLRGLVKPPPGHGIAYVDWSQQEFGIAAALSGDSRMCAAYRSGDPYLEFAKQAGLAPMDATKETHEQIRELCKTCVLGVQYGMEEYTLAQRLDQPPILARKLLRAHHDTYRTFWKWSDAAVDFAMLRNYLPTVFGWRIGIDANYNSRSLRNFPMQANGAEMLRLACMMGTEQGIEICAPVHDAVLIMAPLNRLDADVRAMQEIMAKASRIVLDGFELRSDAKIIEYPNRYLDKRGVVMWNRVWSLINDNEGRLVA